LPREILNFAGHIIDVFVSIATVATQSEALHPRRYIAQVCAIEAEPPHIIRLAGLDLVANGAVLCAVAASASERESAVNFHGQGIVIGLIKRMPTRYSDVTAKVPEFMTGANDKTWQSRLFVYPLALVRFAVPRTTRPVGFVDGSIFNGLHSPLR
jgi:hypothetical protein